MAAFGDFIDKVFDRYQQVEKADATEKGGIGLGLAICKEIVEQHGGSIAVESTFGSGTTFRNIELPLLELQEK